jgi:ketosteroid isomerase-like protein
MRVKILILAPICAALMSPAAAFADDAKTIAETAHHAYVTAINSNDTDTLMAAMTSDIVYQSPGEPELVGQAAVRKWVANYFAAVKSVWDKQTLSFTVSGDWAVERYSWKVTETDRKTGVTTHTTGKGINIYHHDTDGHWRVAIDGWSGDAAQ